MNDKNLFKKRQEENIIEKDSMALFIAFTKHVLDGSIASVETTVDIQKLYEIAKYHGIENIIYKALCDFAYDIPAEIEERFKVDYDMSIMMEALQTAELDLICDELSKIGVDNMPLKGSVLKHLYPSPELRKLGDVDILIKSEMDSIFTLMKELGYTCKDCANTNEIHVTFVKKPYMCVEMHRRLLPESDRASYLDSIVWDYAIQENNRFYMRDEFLYVYCLAHFCRHLYNGGAGIKMLIDMYLIKNKCHMDETILRDLLNRSKLTGLDRLVNKLIDLWYGDGETAGNSVIGMLERLVINSGSYGNMTIKTFLRQNENSANKKKNMLKEILPPYSRIKWQYRPLLKHPILLPYYWARRLAEAVLFDQTKITRSLKNNLCASSSDSDIECLLNAIRS